MIRNGLRLFVALAVVLAVVPGSVAGDDLRGTPNLDATISDSSLTPGTERALQVQLINDGRVIDGSNTRPSSQVTTARAVTVTVKEGDAPIDVETGRQAVGSVPDDEIRQLSVPISVPPTQSPGRTRSR